MSTDSLTINIPTFYFYPINALNVSGNHRTECFLEECGQLFLIKIIVLVYLSSLPVATMVVKKIQS
jgi:hypothetical protein